MGEAAPTLLDTNNVKHVLGEESSSESTPGRPAAQHSAPVSRIPRLIQSPKAQNKIPMINLQGQRSHSVTGQIAAEEKPGSSILESTMLYNRSRRPSTAPKERTEVNAVILSQESRREKEVAQNNQEGQHQLRHVLDGSSTTASLDSMAAPVKEARRALSARSSVTLNARQSEVQENLNDEPKISSIDNNEKRARSQLECSSIANLTAKEQSRSNSLRNPGAGMAASDCAEHHQSGGIPHAHHNDRYSHRSYCSRSPPGSVLLSMVHFRRNGTRATTTGTLGKSNRLPFLKGLKEAVVDSERGPPTSPINRFALGRASSVPRYPPSCFTPLGCGVEDRAFGITLAGGCGENRVLGPACVYGRTDGFVKAPPVQRNEHVRKTKGGFHIMATFGRYDY
ncbi:hypothetical protein BJ742DRAFT_859434 [Cladochytrium replicatum]|nr:hypothetical protein BJ742DRAFT_859434 [Cladochytrium replicatum]